MRRHRALLALLLLAPVKVMAASGSACPDARTTTGLYRNYSYGFTVVIPKGFDGYWNSAACVEVSDTECTCMGDHGRSIPLKGGGSISIDADPRLYDSVQTAVYKDIQQFESRTGSAEPLLERLEPARVRAMKAQRYLARSWKADEAVVREAVFVLLPWGTQVAVSIEAPEAQYRKNRSAYLAILDSLKPAPRE